MKKYTHKIKGMHCASCELLIEKKLIELPEIQAVDASTVKGEVTIYYQDKRPTEEKINELLKGDGYCLCEICESSEQIANPSTGLKGLLTSIVIAGTVFAGFLLLNRLGLSGLVNVSASSSLPAFFFLGLLAGISTCAALTGGIVLSMSQQWQEGYAKNDSLNEKMKPHLLFNAGRIASYALLGVGLGVIGNKLQLSLTFNALLVIAVSVFMILTGLKMLGVKALQGFQITLPKSLAHKATDQKNFQGKYMPFSMGFLTILLPCGFAITVESLALLSGNMTQGALIMAAFALGTAPGLLAIGFSTVKMWSSSKAATFPKIAGVLVLLFAFFNINSQLNVLGLPSLNNFNLKASANAQTDGIGNRVDISGLAPIVNGKQLLQMQANANGYSPNYFKVKTGVPVRWEITDIGTSGCTNAVMSKSLFEGQISLTPGQISVKEFTPTKIGRYKFSCWMGMVTGVIEVINQNGSAATNNGVATAEIPSGAKGCGCGGGGTGSCGGAK